MKFLDAVPANRKPLRGVLADMEGYPMREPTEKLTAILFADYRFCLVVSHGNIILSRRKSWFMRASSFAVADR
jgi:hypothetical protein